MDDLQRRLTLAHQLADVAGTAIRAQFRRSHLFAETKKDLISALVTAADLEAEEAMIQVLAQTLPADGVIREEGENRPSQSGYTWVIDPLDGTSSFARGFSLFGVLIGLTNADNQPLLGVADQPITGERWQGVRGEVSRLQGEPIVNPYVGETQGRLEDVCLCSSTPLMFTTPQQRHVAETFQRRCRRSAFGGDCFNYLALASGWSALPLVILEADLQFYDFCALIPIIEGAGAVITDWSGEPLTSASKEVLAASNLALHQEALAVLKQSLQS
ncbi:MAG: inositol monophosphatase family protein [Cyanobacteriota bacterium]|jgi:inositol-phosphate phosphatase/L-galactose 1-phosphate phosphatase/histidinol-phosphatase